MRRLASFPLAGVGLLLAGSAEAADPAALRLLHGEEAGVAVDVGTTGLSLGADLGPLVGLTVDPGAWVGAALGTSVPLNDPERPWGGELSLAGGAAALLATPGVALTGTAALRGGLRTERLLLTGGLLSPAALRLGWPLEALLPVDLELCLGVRLGEVWLGARSLAGGAFVPGAPPALRTGLAGWVRVVPTGRRR